jgi:hypothetical protein
MKELHHFGLGYERVMILRRSTWDLTIFQCGFLIFEYPEHITLG